MELDKRIKEGKRPLTCFDTEQAKEFLGKECYFTDNASDFQNLSIFEDKEKYKGIDTLYKINDSKIYPFYMSNTPEDTSARYILPCEWVEEKKEPKYRPYTIKDFEEAFLKDEFDDFIIMREKENHDNVYTLRYNGNFIYSHTEYICLGGKNIDFRVLFENYEVANYDGDFVPFGLLEE